MASTGGVRLSQFRSDTFIDKQYGVDGVHQAEAVGIDWERDILCFCHPWLLYNLPRQNNTLYACCQLCRAVKIRDPITLPQNTPRASVPNTTFVVFEASHTFIPSPCCF